MITTKFLPRGAWAPPRCAPPDTSWGPRMRRAVALVMTGVASVLLLGACKGDPNSVANQANSGDRKNYVSGDGSIERIAVAKRGPAVDLVGTTLDGKAWTSADARGKALVVNVWGSWCGPCANEAAGLQKAWTDLSAAKKPVQFIGIDIQEGASHRCSVHPQPGAHLPVAHRPARRAHPLAPGQGRAHAHHPRPGHPGPDRRPGQRRVSTTTTLTDLVDDVLSGATG